MESTSKNTYLWPCIDLGVKGIINEVKRKAIQKSNKKCINYIYLMVK